MPPPEFRLLKVSLLEDGWTQPVVAHPEPDESGRFPIVDGFHRWTLSADPEVAAMTGGLIPVVFLDRDRADRIMATIRHNRARGEHGVRPMAALVRELLESGADPAELGRRLGMESEEVERLAERAGLPAVVARRKGDDPQFSEGWIPG